MSGPDADPDWSPFGVSDEQRAFEGEQAEIAPPPNPDAADVDEAKKLEDLRRLQEHQALAFWRGVFSSEVGRREMYGILKETGLYGGVVHWSRPNGAPDHYATQYHNGRRDLGFRFFLNWSRLDREGVFKMLDENDAAFMKTATNA